jgi:hypothetical protein
MKLAIFFYEREMSKVVVSQNCENLSVVKPSDARRANLEDKLSIIYMDTPHLENAKYTNEITPQKYDDIYIPDIHTGNIRKGIIQLDEDTILFRNGLPISYRHMDITDKKWIIWNRLQKYLKYHFDKGTPDDTLQIELQRFVAKLREAATARTSARTLFGGRKSKRRRPKRKTRKSRR